jgi:O-antigen/teichoic acid export membrane protein
MDIHWRRWVGTVLSSRSPNGGERARDCVILVSATEFSDPVPRPSSSPVADAQTVGSSSIWRHIRRDLLLLGAGNAGTVVAQLAFRFILIAALIPADYGRLSLILAIYNTVWVVGASGLPSSVARHIAVIAPADDSAIIRTAIRAGAGPIVIATVLVATVSGVLLNSSLAFLFAAMGLPSLVYSLLAMGVLRGRGRMGSAASILPIAAIGEVLPLAILWSSGIGVTPLSAFGVFCFGNALGLLTGCLLVRRTSPRRAPIVVSATEEAPSARELLGFSMWLGAATAGVAILPLIMRSAAVLDSYTTVAMVDVAIVLLAIPQRIGTVILLAVVPHASRALGRGGVSLTISRRENLAMIIPFLLAAALVAFTPVVGWLFDALGRPVYARGSGYLALALVAGPVRILYGIVEGLLIAHGDGRFLAVTALSITAAASGMIFAATALGSTFAAFALFVLAYWAIYLCSHARMRRLNASRESSSTTPSLYRSASVGRP